jgi:two-component system response regulator DesR
MRILIADHQDKVRFALCTLLRRQMGWEIVGEAVSADQVLQQARLHDPDLAVLHWRLCEDMSGLLRKVRQISPETGILVLSARPEARCDALAAGADAFVCKMDPPQALVTALHDLTNGRSSRQGSQKLLAADLDGTEPALDSATA